MGKIKLFKRVCLLQISKIKSISTVNKTILCLKFRNNKTPTKDPKFQTQTLPQQTNPIQLAPPTLKQPVSSDDLYAFH